MTTTQGYCRMTTPTAPRQCAAFRQLCGQFSPPQEVASTTVKHSPHLQRGLGGVLSAVLLVVFVGNAAAQESPKGYVLYVKAPFQVLTYDAIPTSGDEGKPMSISACPGEYEPASFSVFAAEDLKNVTLEVSPLSSGAETIPSDAVDIRVVKWWYQTGRGGTPGIEARRHRH